MKLPVAKPVKAEASPKYLPLQAQILFTYNVFDAVPVTVIPDPIIDTLRIAEDDPDIRFPVPFRIELK